MIFGSEVNFSKMVISWALHVMCFFYLLWNLEYKQVSIRKYDEIN
jgi:hypothetical protein